ncbi:glucosaminidase domain-containing protein [Aeromonas salmonicida]|uniref:glucosaminidase domain-containing protein n=1 Tax=Aeromonas salmonicida TaxID=645 RepID=UPI003D20075C
MKFAFPILTAKGEEFKDVKALTSLINGEQSGHYLLGNHNKWHGGVHISDKSAPWCKDKYPVRAIADGKVVAFRMMKDYLTSEYQGESLRYSNCFCLVQHEYCEINAETKAKNEFTFYSLYMHLLPWDKYQSAEKLVLKKGWNARNSVPHANPDAEQQRVDAALPRFTLPKDTELEMDSSAPSQKGNVGGKEYDFIKVIIKSKLSNAQIKEAEKAGVLVSEGSSVWIANSPDAVEVIKPNLPTWLFDQIEAELLTNMVGRADPVLNGPTGRLMAGDRSVSLPADTKLQYDAHQLEFHWIGDKARKMARCNYVMPNIEGSPGSCGVAWVCVEDEFIKAKTLPPSHLGELYVLPSPVAIAAGETIGYLGLVETPGSLIGGKKSKHQVHLEVFTQDPRLDDVLANKAGTKGGATYAKVPAELVLHEKKKQDGKDLWVATGDKSLEALVESPKLEKDAAKQEWVCVSSGKYVKKEQVELLSQHDWLKIGFKKVDGTGSDGYLDPDAPPTFFTKLVKSFDTDSNGELSSEEIQAALQNSGNADQLHKLIVKHPSEWYEKSSASSYLWLDKLMAKVGLPDFDQLVDHEKQRIDKLEWMQSAAKLKLHSESWHFFPLIFREKKTASRLPKNFTRSEFVTFVYESAKESQAISRVPAEITAAQAILETGYGKSVPIDVNTGIYSYNLFGIKAHGHPEFVEIYTHEYEGGVKVKILDKFRAYDSFEDSISGRADFFVKNKRYHSLFESSDPVLWAQGLQDKGYATDPKYAYKLISIMKTNGWVK